MKTKIWIKNQMKMDKPAKIETVVATGHKTVDSVGVRLRKARTELGCSRYDAAAKTKIPERYIARFEDGAYDKLPDDVYAKIFLKVYCKFLGLDVPTIIALQRQERLRAAAPHKSAAGTAVKRHPTRAIPAWQMLITPQLIRAVIVIAAVLGLAIYFWLAVRNIMAPPVITLSSPNDNLVTSEHSVIVEGRTDLEVSLRINGKYVAPDSFGNFRDTLELQDGLNEVNVVGMKKHSREARVTRRILVEPKEHPTAAALPGPVIKP